MDLIQDTEYVHCQHFFVLQQATLLDFLYGRYGAKGEQKVVTVDDKVRVAGIIFRDDMRSYIQNMVGTSRGSRIT
jgi:hypothetical protein